LPERVPVLRRSDVLLKDVAKAGNGRRRAAVFSPARIVKKHVVIRRVALPPFPSIPSMYFQFQTRSTGGLQFVDAEVAAEPCMKILGFCRRARAHPQLSGNSVSLVVHKSRHRPNSTQILAGERTKSTSTSPIEPARTPFLYSVRWPARRLSMTFNRCRRCDGHQTGPFGGLTVQVDRHQCLDTAVPVALLIKPRVPAHCS